MTDLSFQNLIFFTCFSPKGYKGCGLPRSCYSSRSAKTDFAFRFIRTAPPAILHGIKPCINCGLFSFTFAIVVWKLFLRHYGQSNCAEIFRRKKKVGPLFLKFLELLCDMLCHSSQFLQRFAKVLYFTLKVEAHAVASLPPHSFCHYPTTVS